MAARIRSELTRYKLPKLVVNAGPIFSLRFAGPYESMPIHGIWILPLLETGGRGEEGPKLAQSSFFSRHLALLEFSMCTGDKMPLPL